MIGDGVVATFDGVLVLVMMCSSNQRNLRELLVHSTENTALDLTDMLPCSPALHQLQFFKMINKL